MASTEFSVFKRFPELPQAKELADFLLEQGIPAQLVDNSPPLDITFTGNIWQNQVEVKIPAADFEQARQLLNEWSEVNLKQVPKDYYLFEFSAEELREILAKSDEWSEFDALLARKILQSRGQEISDDELRALRQQRVESLSQPTVIAQGWILLGYVLSLLGGLFGIFLGYFLWTQQKALPNGTKVYAYQPHARQHGKRIFWLGIVVLVMGFWAQVFLG
jgi:hypothetical protein